MARYWRGLRLMCLRFQEIGFGRSCYFVRRICVINVQVIAFEKEEKFVGHDDLLKWKEDAFAK